MLASFATCALFICHTLICVGGKSNKKKVSSSAIFRRWPTGGQTRDDCGWRLATVVSVSLKPPCPRDPSATGGGEDIQNPSGGNEGQVFGMHPALAASSHPQNHHRTQPLLKQHKNLDTVGQPRVHFPAFILPAENISDGYTALHCTALILPWERHCSWISGCCSSACSQKLQAIS